MYRILNRARKRPQMDWKTLHMWFVNMIYTLVSLSSLLLAARGEERAVPREGSRQSRRCQQRSWVTQFRMQLTTKALLLHFSHCPFKRVTEEGLMERGMGVIFTLFALEKGRNRWTSKFPCCCLYQISDDIWQIHVRASPASKIADMSPYNPLLYQSLCIYLYKSSKKCMNPLNSTKTRLDRPVVSLLHFNLACTITKSKEMGFFSCCSFSRGSSCCFFRRGYPLMFDKANSPKVEWKCKWCWKEFLVHHWLCKIWVFLSLEKTYFPMS